MVTVTHKFYVGDVLQVLRTLPDESVHCCVTSPPYWGLRDYGVPGQLGLESTPEEYVANMVEVFREVRRVLRNDGTLWLNLGDSYAGNREKATKSSTAVCGNTKLDVCAKFNKVVNGLKPKDLVGIPWRVALALQADGWYLRSDIIWHKLNAMPESVTDRPTKAHEYIFLLTKSQRYFYDAEAIREPAEWNRWGKQTLKKDYRGIKPITESKMDYYKSIGRNKRTVWQINTKPFKGAHFAVFPPEIPETCIKAGTSEYGCCPKCGAPWERVLEKVGVTRHGSSRKRADAPGAEVSATSVFRTGEIVVKTTIGWRPTCACGIKETVPCVVLDPFGGSGTTTIVAEQLGRSSIYIDINPEYAEMAKRRLKEIQKNGIQLIV